MENTIGNTIESILNQNYPTKEIIVIDGESTDNTIGIIKKYPVKILTEKTGISNARNLGYKNSTGDYIAFTDADCVLDPQWTKKMLEGFIDEQVGLVGGITQFRTDNSYTSVYRSLEFSKKYNNVKKKEVVWAGGPGSMFRRRVLDEIGGFNPNWVYGEDAEISFLTIEHGYKILKQDEAITYHIPDRGFWKLVRKGYRDSKAYVRVATSHFKTTFLNKFNSTWYFPYDLYLLPILYAFLFLSIILFPMFYFVFFFFSPNILCLISFQAFLEIWIYITIFIVVFLFVYGLIPSLQVAILSKKKKIKAFFGTILIHHTRGFAWGIGLIIGIKNIIFRKY